MSGKNSNDTSNSPIPTVVQGSQWGGTPILAGTAAGSYQILSYTWAFPSGALKGYGTFTTNTNDPSGPYITFAGHPTSASNTTVQVVSTFSSDDLTNQQGAGVNDPDVFNQFYWGPQATGNQTVSVSAQVQNTTIKATMKLGDSAVTNVIQPQGNITTVLGTAGLSAGGANYDGSQFLGIDINGLYNSSNGKVTGTVGISPDGVVNTTGLPAGTTGQYAIVQTITEGASRSDYYNGSLMPASTVYEDDTLPDGSMPSSRCSTRFFPTPGSKPWVLAWAPLEPIAPKLPCLIRMASMVILPTF